MIAFPIEILRRQLVLAKDVRWLAVAHVAIGAAGAAVGVYVTFLPLLLPAGLMAALASLVVVRQQGRINQLRSEIEAHYLRQGEPARIHKSLIR